jgi:hypothetical protein
LQQRYIEWMSTAPECTVKPPVEARLSVGTEVFVINNYMRDWGHRFIYDVAVLRFSLETAKFKNVIKCSLGYSEIEELRGLEHESRLPEGFLRLETITLEAEK